MNYPNQFSLIIIMPIYEDVDASKKLFKELRTYLNENLFIVAVDDGSVIQQIEAADINEADLDGVVIKLKRNVGHQRAIAIGLSYVADKLSNFNNVVIMDSDGEDLPSTIPLLLTKLKNSEVDVVVAQRKNRVETFRFQIFYILYKWLFNILSGRSIRFGNFMVLNSVALKRLVSMHELWIHLAACVLNSKLRFVSCLIDRGPRYAGKSKMNFVSLALHGFKGMMVFAEDILVRVGIACALVASLTVLCSFVAIGLKIANYATPGWFSVALGILLLVFLQTGALTLMTLMLTGIVRVGLISNITYLDYVSSINYINKYETIK